MALDNGAVDHLDACLAFGASPAQLPVQRIDHDVQTEGQAADLGNLREYGGCGGDLGHGGESLYSYHFVCIHFRISYTNGS